MRVRFRPSPSVFLAHIARHIAPCKTRQICAAKTLPPRREEERRRANSTLCSLLAQGGDCERHLKRRHIVNTKTIMSTPRRGLGWLQRHRRHHAR
jgi:hypothetical protein